MIRFFSRFFLDSETIFTVLTQFLSLLFPLFFMWYLTKSYGREVVIDFEALLSLVAFSLIVQDFGTSIFLSHRMRTNIAWSKVIGAAIAVKFTITLFLVGLTGLLLFWFETGVSLFICYIVAVFFGCLDVPFVLFSRGKSHYYSILVAFKFPLCMVFLPIVNDPNISFVLSSVAVSLVALVRCMQEVRWNIGFSKRIYVFLINKYKLYGVTEAFTSIFSQLDGYLVSQVLSKEHAFVYLLVRKCVRAINALMNYVYRIAYTRKKQNHSEARHVVIFLLAVNFCAVVGMNLFFGLFFETFFGLELDPENILGVVVVSQSLLLLMGCMKTLVRNTFVFVVEAFKFHFYVTFFASLIFIVPVFGSYYLEQGLGAAYVSNLRLSADLFYVVCTVVFYLKTRSYRQFKSLGLN